MRTLIHRDYSDLAPVHRARRESLVPLAGKHTITYYAN
jgi:hypothetical protein